MRVCSITSWSIFLSFSILWFQLHFSCSFFWFPVGITLHEQFETNVLINRALENRILVLLIMVGKAAFVSPFSLLSNFIRKDRNENIKIKQQSIVRWAALMWRNVFVALDYIKLKLEFVVSILINYIWYVIDLIFSLLDFCKGFKA